MILDLYKSSGSPILRIGNGAVFSGFAPSAKKFLQRIKTEKTGEIKKISCVSDINDAIKAEIKDAFSVDFSDVKDAYIIKTENGELTVFAKSESAALYAAARIAAEDGIPAGLIYNYPSSEFRMLKLYLPSPENIPFFKSLIDISVHYGFNTVMLEVGGAMEYKSHPEIAEGWREYSKTASDHINKRGSNPNFPYKDEASYFFKNSIHCENGDGKVLTQDEVRELIDYCRGYCMEVIPEVPSFSHSDYLLTRHPELAERADDLYPDAYCPSNPESYKLLFDIMEEIIDVFKPLRMNICHDEAYSIGLCEKCRKKTAEELYVGDITKIHDFLAERGVRTMIWSDKLINSIDKTGTPWGGAFKEVRHPKTGELMETIAPTYNAIDKIPKDIQILHWFWSIDELAEENFIKHGFFTVFGNFEPLRIKNSVSRLKKGLSGAGVSNWSKVDEVHIQRNGIYMSLALAGSILWARKINEECPDENILAAANDLYRYRTKCAPYKAEIVHTYTKDIPFELYLDGYEVDSEKNTIGAYSVEYADGSRESFPMEFGKTLGYAYASRERRESNWCQSYEPDNRIMEPAYSCDYIFNGNKVYYKYAILSDREIKSVTLDVKAEHREFVEVKEIKI